MSYLSRNLKKLKESSFTGFTENSKFVKNDFVFISLSENSKEALNHTKEAIKNGAKIIVSDLKIKGFNIFPKAGMVAGGWCWRGRQTSPSCTFLAMACQPTQFCPFPFVGSVRGILL